MGFYATFFLIWSSRRIGNYFDLTNNELPSLQQISFRLSIYDFRT